MRLFLTPHRYRQLQAGLMAALGGYLLWNAATGAIFLYINERFLPLIVFGGVAALALALGAWPWPGNALDHDHHHDHHDHDHSHDTAMPIWGLAAMLVPLALAALIPAQPLGANAISTRGIGNSAPLTASGDVAAKLDIPSEQRSILDWVRAYNYSADPAEFNGQTAEVIGFVYRAPSLTNTQFMVSRFVVTCCAADGTALAMVVNWPQTANLTDNTWVRVRGPVEAVFLNGQPIPRINAETVEPVPQPDHPYMYP